MTHSPEQFARLLYHSTLSVEERKAVLEMLPGLNRRQLERLIRLLVRDWDDAEKVMNLADSRRKKALLKLHIEIASLQKEQ
jgi:hypothetical protein